MTEADASETSSDANTVFGFHPSRRYRNDIDGLRAIAVLAVIFFHFSVLPSGFLGVDVFFVISGFLITGIIYRELEKSRFSMLDFYERRTRRILPLATFICAVALVIGVFTMLPDDMENMAQSVVASNFFANNILQDITTANYWDTINEYKPLMHTWSLGIEEQYYFVYPILLWIVGTKRLRLLLPMLVVFGIGSLVLFCMPFAEHHKFYLLPFRFYELAAGGIAAILLQRRVIRHSGSPLLLAALIVLLVVDMQFLSADVRLILTVAVTTALLATQNSASRISTFVLENRVFVGIGLISFSLYMWHQVLLAYARYFMFEELRAVHLVGIFVVTVGLSIATYYGIEKPARDKKRFRTRTVLAGLALGYVLTTAGALYIYVNAGVVRDVPELELTTDNATRGMHAVYNSRPFAINRDFGPAVDSKTRVLVIGNSFARDWANVLSESAYANDIDLTYFADPGKEGRYQGRIREADVIFVSRPGRPGEIEEFGLGDSPFYVIGAKNFGVSNGIFYNYSGDDYFKQRAKPAAHYLETNSADVQKWGDSGFIDYFDKVTDRQGTVPVFTPSGKFISQDCSHLTRAGAVYFAELFDSEIRAALRGRVEP